ncbi:MAG TPA: hypothetical protein VFS41_10335 [Edaphobacter sp.]|nr:hypothetical protein [Edaphobacter sp.]
MRAKFVSLPTPRTRSASLFCTMVLMLLAATAHAQVEVESPQQEPSFSADTWHLCASPYLWLAGLNGDLNLAGHDAAVHQSFGDIFSNLKIGFMGLGEARRGRVGVLTDLLFVRVGDQQAVPVPQLPFPVQVKLTTTTFTLTPELAYRVYSHKHFAADVLGGFRYYHLGAHSNFDAGPLGQYSYAGSSNWVDVTGGARLLARLTPKIGAFVIGDAGGGGSSPSWEIAYGVGYKVLKNATAQIGYKRLYFDRKDGTAFGLEATQQGLVIGTTVRLR